MFLGGIVGGGGGAKPPKQKPEPEAKENQQKKAKAPREEAKAAQPEPKAAQPEPKSVQPAPKTAQPEPKAVQPEPKAAAGEPAAVPKAQVVLTGDDARRGAVAQSLAAETAQGAPKAGARVEDEAGAAEMQARRTAEAAVDSARISAVLDRVAPAEKPATALLTEPATYGEESPYAAATSAEPGAARGGERAVDARA